MNEQKRQRLYMVKRLSSARICAAALNNVFLSLHDQQHFASGCRTTELTGADIPRQPIESGFSIHGGRMPYIKARISTGGVTFARWQRKFPAVVTHLGIWDAVAGGQSLTPALFALDKPIVLQPGDVLHFPPGMSFGSTE